LSITHVSETGLSPKRPEIRASSVDCAQLSCKGYVSFNEVRERLKIAKRKKLERKWDEFFAREFHSICLEKLKKTMTVI
jgi:hypothetical protein